MTVTSVFYVIVVVMTTVAVCWTILRSPRSERLSLRQDMIGAGVSVAILVAATVSVMRIWSNGEPSEMFASGLGYLVCVAIVASVCHKALRDRRAWRRSRK